MCETIDGVDRLETLIGQRAVSADRRAALASAIAAGASPEILAKILDASRVAVDREAVVVPAHRFEGLSRGRGWARRGKGDRAQWGERVKGGYRVGPGKWVVGATDGFRRRSSNVWRVEHVRVGDQTWTLAVTS